MIELNSEQREYKERTLRQLLANQALLETALTRETRPDVVKSIEVQLEDIEAHVNRLQDELTGNVVFDEPIADELFKQAARALANERFHLAKRYVQRLETIEPFYPGLARMRQEAEARRASRRTRAIAEGRATSYPGVTLSLPPEAVVEPSPPQVEPGEVATAEPSPQEPEEEPRRWWSSLFQLHIILSCLTVVIISCVMASMFGMTVLQWLVEGG